MLQCVAGALQRPAQGDELGKKRKLKVQSEGAELSERWRRKTIEGDGSLI